MDSSSTYTYSNGENGEHDDFLPREYQTQLFDVAKKKNVILFLPTGSGKTYISILLLKHFSASMGMNSGHETNRKWSYFLVNTTTLVRQQARVIRNSTNFKVCELTGDLGVDNWSKDHWNQLLKDHQVFVMTAQIYLDAIRMKKFAIENSCVLILDECHHATKEHPMSVIMDEYRQITKYGTENQMTDSEIPRVVGLSGTLINSSIKNASAIQKLWKGLEYKMCATIVTIPDRDHIKSYSTNPQEFDVSYKVQNDFPEQLANRLNLCTEVMMYFNNPLESNAPSIAPNSEEFFRLALINDPFKALKRKWANFIADIKEVMKSMGCYGFYHCSREWYIKVENMRMLVGGEFPIVFECMNQSLAELHVLTRIELEKYGVINNPIEMRRSFPDKMNKLLEQLEMADNDANARTIVFVERKIIAIAVYQFLKKFSECHEPLKSMKVEYLIGNTGYKGNLSREPLMTRRNAAKVMKKFEIGEINTVIATNLLEEGMDIAACNKIIMFDFPKTWCSYVQSKGRARSSTSKCIYLVPDNAEGKNMLEKKETYKEVEKEIDRLCRLNFDQNFEFIFSSENDLLDDDDSSEFDPESEYYAAGPGSAKVTLDSAISVINCYCQSNNSDRYCDGAPEYRFKVIRRDEDKYFKCWLWLPTRKYRDFFVGDECATIKSAKKSVALKAVKELHRLKEIDDLFRPLKKKVSETDMLNWCPHKRVDNGANAGTKSNVEQYDVFSSPLLSSQFPMNVKSCYLQVFTMMLDEDDDFLPERKKLLRNMMLRPNVTYGIITSEKLPNLPSFPVYTNVGKMYVKIWMNAKQIELNSSQFESLKKFHAFLFVNVLRVVKTCLMMNSNGVPFENNYLVVPVKRLNSDRFDIDWEIAVINKYNELVAPSLKEKQDAQYTNEKYFEKIVVPYYRPYAPLTHYVVIKKMEGETTASSLFPDMNSSYKEYFESKYSVDIVQQNQPLLPVIAISDRINCITPRLKSDKQSQKYENRGEDLLPELCVLQELPAVYWIKAMVVPSIVHRVSGLLVAHHLNCKLLNNIIEDEKSTSTDFDEPANVILELDCAGLDENDNKITTVRDVEETLNAFQKILNYGELKDVPQIICESIPVDTRRFVERNDKKLTYFDVMYALKYEKEKPAAGEVFSDLFDRNESKRVEFVPAPELSILNYHGHKNPLLKTPAQIEVYRSLLLMKCNEGLNQERLETLGDSLLKYLCSHFLYSKCGDDYTEGHLTTLKSEIVGNRNLYNCGIAAGLPAYVRGNIFKPREEWLPPCFNVPNEIKARLELMSMPLALLDLVEIPPSEQISGEISHNTIVNVDNRLTNYMDTDFEPSTNCALVNKQWLNDKNVADTVEALLGTFLLSNGIYGAARLSRYLGILSAEKVANVDELLYNKHILRPTQSLKTGEEIAIKSIFPDYKCFESILQYEFQDPFWLLQALTHPSHNNRFTDSYEKLEFLGDAILDFLITGYIYQYCGDLSPGEVTDLRSALVNNVTFGSLAVCHNYHKFMKLNSHALNTVIGRFVGYMQQRNFQIGEELLFLVSDDECTVAEFVEVAKPLGDIFESVAAAIYLDSGNNLSAVWSVYYNLMRPVIDKFSKNVPKNPVRLLEEMKIPNSDKNWTQTYDEKSGRNLVMLEYVFRGQNYKSIGVSNSKQSAKKAAAKVALKTMRENKMNLQA